MNGHLYAVIFDQGTTKVGMTEGDPKARFIAHKTAGNRWGISVYKNLSMEVLTGDLEYREKILCGYCYSKSVFGAGFEWMRFKNAETAEREILDFFERIKRNEFCSPGALNNDYKKWEEMQLAAAIGFIERGMTAQETARVLGMNINAITTTEKYKTLIQERDAK